MYLHTFFLRKVILKAYLIKISRYICRFFVLMYYDYKEVCIYYLKALKSTFLSIINIKKHLINFYYYLYMYLY